MEDEAERSKRYRERLKNAKLEAAAQAQEKKPAAMASSERQKKYRESMKREAAGLAKSAEASTASPAAKRSKHLSKLS